jgi:hypothetical protein
MANILGVPEYDPSLDRLNMQLQSQAIQQLGAQVRADLTQIQTNRQLQGFSQGLQGLSTQSPDFGRGVVGLMTQYPLAAHSPIGQAAINTLGAEHKAWQAGLLKNQSPYRAVGGGYGVLDQRTGEITSTPEGTLPSKPWQVVKDAYGNPITTRDPNNFNQEVALPEFPIKTSEDAVELANVKHQNALDLLGRKPGVASPAQRALGQSFGTIRAQQAKILSEADKYEQLAREIQISDEPYPGDKNGKTYRNKRDEAAYTANSLRKQASTLEAQASDILRSLQGTYSEAPAQGVDVGALIPETPASTPAPKRRVFNKDTFRLE